MGRCPKLLLAGVLGLFLFPAVPGLAGPPGPEAAAAGTTPPALNGDAKGAPTAKKDVLDAKPLGKNEAPAKNETPAKNDAPAVSGKAAQPEAAADAEKDAKRNAKAPNHRKGIAPKETKPKVGQGPSPATPPPLTIGGLRDEVRREAAPATIDPSSPARSKVEQMLAEITKTREALRDETARLEAMMSDGPESGTAGAASGGAPGSGSAKPAAKNPLDVLAKALRGIKPELAAPIVARLDKRLAATVLLRMPPVDAGKIMGALKPDTAAELATQISMRVTPGEMKR